MTVSNEDIDRALKIAQLTETVAKMGGTVAFEPIARLAAEALHEFKVDMGDPKALEEEERRQGREAPVEVVEPDNNPTPAAREADGIDNDDDGEVDEPDEVDDVGTTDATIPARRP